MAAKSGSMNTTLMLQYIDQVLAPKLVPENKSALLIMDQYRAHLTDEVNEALKKIRVTPLILPGKILFNKKILVLVKLS